ncbi:MAG: HisA/HisF-related TIM barrel protein [Candidatus Hydrothermarchaeota archaeon]
MKIVPVIDLLNGKVVRAIGGKRDEYKVINSRLCPEGDPLKFIKNLGAPIVYVADLDAITGGEVQIQLLEEISSHVKTWIDAGIKKVDEMKDISEIASKVIIATETFQDYGNLEKHECKDILMSIDMYKGKIISSKNYFKDPFEILERFEKFVEGFILLDLYHVGRFSGIWDDFTKYITKTEKEIIVGGGIRDKTDLFKLKNIGIHAVLVGSALHNGKIELRWRI